QETSPPRLASTNWYPQRPIPKGQVRCLLCAAVRGEIPVQKCPASARHFPESHLLNFSEIKIILSTAS
ncbi:hypothetical protein C6536_29380, partial [Escherichia coli]|nr:hypothetical protein [Escherichia coli]